MSIKTLYHPKDAQKIIRRYNKIIKYFIIILIVSTNYIFVHLLDNKMFYPFITVRF